ncbi:MAG: ABC transporter permease [Armatimonadota bacterium]|nr:ABC transporter permease [Armatimonadota bacterium]
MSTYTIKRILLLVLQAWLTVSALFVVFRLAPGDPAVLIAGPGATQAQIDLIRHQLRLDRPLAVQYIAFVRDTLRGDLGISLSFRRPVLSVIASRIPPTLALLATSLGLAVILGVPSGVVAAVRPLSLVSQATMGLTVLFLSVPNFLLGLLLMDLLAVRLRWLPAAGTGGPIFLVMPTIAIAARLLALVARTTRASVLEILGEDYIRTARAKGLSGSTILVRHALKPAMIPIVTMIGLQGGYLLGGSIVIETLFSYQGLGQAMINAVSMRDYFLVQGIALFYVAGFLLINLLVDLSYALFDPRIRYV